VVIFYNVSFDFVCFHFIYAHLNTILLRCQCDDYISILLQNHIFKQNQFQKF